ncbi:DUF1016 N-terminal domain-containing protein [Arthrobacter sp. NPDC080031]|uniref:DUF1016 N-terminal domain-containing protein n=1 Tax=Arthrobacter sp. NPDC080031 TaxID=3155918 RepID=UPI00344BF64F
MSVPVDILILKYPSGEEPISMSTPASFGSTPATSTMPKWYPDLLASVAHQIDSGRARAVSAANRELVRAYWSIGCELLARESQEGWGSRVVTRLSADLKERFPEARGFSPRNLRYMKALAAGWPDITCCRRRLQHCRGATMCCCWKSSMTLAPGCRRWLPPLRKAGPTASWATRSTTGCTNVPARR